MALRLPTTFRGYLFEKFGDALQEIKLRTDLTHAPLGPSQIRVKVFTTALNPVDHKLVEVGARFMPTAPTAENPCRLGFDAAGKVVEVGADVSNVKIDDEVLGMAYFGSTGTWAEYAVLEAANVVHKPTSLSFGQAAGLPLVGQTTYQALTTHGHFQAGQRVLILGGSTATGAIAIQVAKALGASFVAATASTRNVDFVKSFGADQVIDYTSEKWANILEAHSIDLIYDCGVEPKAWDEGAQSVLTKDTGRLVTIGLPITPSESPIGATYTRMGGRPSQSDLQALVSLADSGKLTIPVDSVYAFEDLLDAVAAQKAGRARGKIILSIASE
ncbi:hypothetical protein Poli38472_012131 [Pythium oligandrum]|uniref:Enoyl reductase (ER) domain-containing protein n=1 Tax=Pythium oligandrum TaxID=41045 RepID=A0A8K1CPB3_PYTOL|nr:hypothetical protein Poli38472_012131 [Pythium oligandrum]|eukprot:TMW67015.1 hypothetical protein Poli38472_012131 [Pythium oligandrum]